jgi:hypothetical protein
MAIIDGLTTLAAVKTALGISDTSKDTQLEGIINAMSATISAYCNRYFKRATITDEVQAVNFHQYLYLDSYPIQSVTSVSVDGTALVSGTDYFAEPADKKAGRLYKPTGWTGQFYSRGTFPEPFAGKRSIKVSYVSGYYLPADVGYIAGADASLPLSLTEAANMAVVERYLDYQRQNQGIESLSEGGLSYTFRSGRAFSDQVRSMLNPFIRRIFA